MRIFGIKIKSEAEKLIEKIELAYENKQNIQIHISRLKNKAMNKYIEDNRERFEDYLDFKSKFEIMKDKTLMLRLQGYEISMNIPQEDFEKTEVIFKFSNRESEV